MIPYPSRPSAAPPLDPQRRDRRLSWAIAGTLLIHAMLAFTADVARSLGKRPPRELAPTVELVDIQVPPPLPPPPPPAPPVVEPPPPLVQPVTTRAPRTAAPQRVATSTAPPPPEETPPPLPADATPGGSPTVALPSAPPSARGVAVRKAAVNTGKVGGGGQGGGTGTQEGSGAGDKPLSVAMIKTQAMPKGDYSYFDARKDYPAEARQLGIEGKLRVRLTVNDRGSVTAAVLLNRLGHGLDEIALAQARRLEFEPAKDTSDRPVSSFVVWTFTFALPSS
ncbi:MAG: TonB family protein [Myxococcales bacterium]|nr:TonB family protein [Myxococcales bacterium]